MDYKRTKNQGGIFEYFKFDKSAFKFNLSTWILIVSNLLVIYLAIKEHWSLSVILIVYWGQSVIIGFFNFIKILNLKNFSTENFRINHRPVEPTERTKIFTAFFFAFHYGIFHLVYIIFLISFFFKELDFTNMAFIIFSISLFFINHFISFRYNKKEDANKKHNIGKVMFFPYARIVPMHLMIVFGLALVHTSEALIFFLVLKTIADLIMHQIEHA